MLRCIHVITEYKTRLLIQTFIYFKHLLEQLLEVEELVVLIHKGKFSCPGNVDQV